MTDPQPNNPITNPTESVYLSRTGIGPVKPAAGHDEDCYGNGCEECQVHAEKCVCQYCVAYRVEHPAPAEPDPYEHLREAMPHPNQLAGREAKRLMAPAGFAPKVGFLNDF